MFYRACLGQCFSYSVPNTFPQSTESLVHCDSCMPAQTQWEVVSVSPLNYKHVYELCQIDCVKYGAIVKAADTEYSAMLKLQ